MKAFRRCAAARSVLVIALLGAIQGARAQTGMVAAAEQLAIQEGERVLAAGGNAIEAAVVTAAVLAVVEPYASGLGGGGYMLVHTGSTGQEFVIDSNVTAPALTTADMFIDPATGEPYDARSINSGGLAVGVPGALQNWDEALRRSRDLLGGTMTLRDALQPAINLAESGFPVSSSFLAIRNRHQTRLNFFPATREIFFPNPPLEEGSMLIQTDLASTLRMVATAGIGVFYNGPIADAISATVQSPGAEDPSYPIYPGRIEPTDLAAYQVISHREPVSGFYRGHRVVSSGPPSGGTTLIELLNLLDGFDFGSPTFGFQEPNTVQAMIEAMKLSYADRTRWVADPAFVCVPVEGLTSSGYADERRALINLSSSLPEGSANAGNPGGPCSPSGIGNPVQEEIGDELEEESSTTQISVIDGAGNMVSYTTTLSELWGSGMVVPAYGFLLNNSLRNFTTSGVGINRPQPDKRPRSFISPTLVFSPTAEPRMVTGSAGGGAIPAIVSEVISSVLDHGKTIQEAISAPRFENENRTTGSSRRTQYENVPPEFVLPAALVQELTVRGQTMLVHMIGTINPRPATFGASQGIAVDPGTGALSRGRDPRRGGDF